MPSVRKPTWLPKPGHLALALVFAAYIVVATGMAWQSGSWEPFYALPVGVLGLGGLLLIFAAMPLWCGLLFGGWGLLFIYLEAMLLFAASKAIPRWGRSFGLTEEAAVLTTAVGLGIANVVLNLLAMGDIS